MGGGGKELGRSLVRHPGTDVRRRRQVGVRRPGNPAGDLCRRPERTLDTHSRRPVHGVHRNVTEAAHGPASPFREMLRTLPWPARRRRFVTGADEDQVADAPPASRTAAMEAISIIGIGS